MYVTLRKYTPQGPLSREVVDELTHRIQDEFLPLLQEIPGFHGYYAVRCGEHDFMTINLFETETGAAESTRRAAEFRRAHPLPVELGEPDVVEGEVIASREAPREVGAH